MASVSLFVFFVLSQLVLLHSAEDGGKLENPYCQPFQCGKLVNVSFPFTNITKFPLPSCGLLRLKCDETPPMIHLPWDDPESEGRYRLINFSSTNTATQVTQHIRVKDLWLSKSLITEKCDDFDNITLLNSPLSFKLTTLNRTIFKCNRHLNFAIPRNFNTMPCDHHNIYYSPSNEASQTFPSECSTIQLPVNKTSHEDELNLTAEFDLELHVSDECSRCHGEEEIGKDIGITQKCFDAHTRVHS